MRVCLRRREGAVSISCFSKLLFLLFFQTSRSRQPSQGRPRSLPAQRLEMATRRGEGWRPRQPRQAEVANEEICAAKQTEPFQGSFDLGLMLEGVAGGSAAPPDPPRAG